MGSLQMMSLNTKPDGKLLQIDIVSERSIYQYSHNLYGTLFYIETGRRKIWVIFGWGSLDANH